MIYEGVMSTLILYILKILPFEMNEVVQGMEAYGTIWAQHHMASVSTSEEI